MRRPRLYRFHFFFTLSFLESLNMLIFMFDAPKDYYHVYITHDDLIRSFILWFIANKQTKTSIISHMILYTHLFSDLSPKKVSYIHHTWSHTHIHTNRHRDTPTHTLTHSRTHIHTNTHTHTHTHIHIHTHRSGAQDYQWRTHTYTHTHIHTYIHTGVGHKIINGELGFLGGCLGLVVCIYVCMCVCVYACM